MSECNGWCNVVMVISGGCSVGGSGGEYVGGSGNVGNIEGWSVGWGR